MSIWKNTDRTDEQLISDIVSIIMQIYNNIYLLLALYNVLYIYYLHCPSHHHPLLYPPPSSSHIAVLLTLLSSDLHRIRTSSTLPLRTATLTLIRQAGEPDSHVHQKVAFPKVAERNREAIGTCMSKHLQFSPGPCVQLTMGL